MDETLLWIPIAIAELLLLVSIVLGFLLIRARKAERQLRRKLEEIGETSQRPELAPKEPPVTALGPAGRNEPVLADFDASTAYKKLDQLLPATEAPRLDDCIEQLQQRLNETSECLQRVAAELQKEKNLSGHSQLEIAELRQSLNHLVRDMEVLRHANARLQQELRSKRGVLDGAILEDRSSKEKILLYIKRLRDELATLQLKLASSEADVQRLRQEREALAADYNALTREYERIYVNFRR